MTDIYDLAGEPRPKFCINCKHIGRNGSGDAQRYRCLAPQNIMSKEIDLVTGNSITNFHFNFCYDARAEGVRRIENCGAEGKWFEEAPPKIIEPSRILANDLLAALNQMK